MHIESGDFVLRLARSEADLRGAERLRYKVFVEELGADGPLVDHEARLERDRYDPDYDHLVLVDRRVSDASLDHVIGVYRLLPGARAAGLETFYTSTEYDLSVLTGSGRRLLELGRSCVHPDHRRGMALPLLWSGLAEYVLTRDIEILFGVASFHGTDMEALALPLTHLYRAHLAPLDLRVRTVEPAYQPMDLLPEGPLDRVAAMRAVPALIKSYLRLGGFVGDGAFVDHDFNTTDVCLVMDTARMSAEARARYDKAAQ